MNPLQLNAAFRFVATALMVIQINVFCHKVGLPLDRPVAVSDIQAGSHIGPMDPTNFTGSVLTDKYFFGFGNGHIANFYQRAFTAKSDEAVRQRNSELAKHPSLIDTNGAHEIATNQLARMGIDIASLESNYHLSVTQLRYLLVQQQAGVLQQLNTSGTSLPWFEIQWTGVLTHGSRQYPDRAVITLTVSGVTKDIIEFHILDDSLFTNAPMQIENSERLAAIRDEEFTNYDSVQRSNLVAQFAKQKPGFPGAATPNAK